MIRKRWSYVLRALAAALVLVVLPSRAQDEKVASLIIDGTTYSNVTIMGRTDTHISFKHSQGFMSVRLTALQPTEQTKVGYTPPPPPKTLRQHLEDYAQENLAWLNDPRLKAWATDLYAEANRILAEDDKVIIQSALAGIGCIYILFCLAVVKICRKTTVRPGIWAWLPGFQFISLFKAAGMNPWSYLALYIPLVNVIVMINWCFRICRTRQKSPVFGFFLLIPLVNIFAFFYLAFSSHKKAPVQNYGPTKLKLSFQS